MHNSLASTVTLSERTAVDYGDGWGGIDYIAAPGEGTAWWSPNVMI